MLRLRAAAKKEQETGRSQFGESRRSALLHIQQDFTNLLKSDDYVIEFNKKPDGSDDLASFIVKIIVRRGPYATATIDFLFEIPDTYPIKPPKVHCKTLPLYHPNIDWEGNVCLNILREDHSSALDLSAFIAGLQFILQEPTSYDPLNKEVGADLERDPEQYKRLVRDSLLGGVVNGRQYTRNPTFKE
ncbi:Ubiquitin-conjugating enzyme [Carpediemonas membranifera]|uniref:Ubiquitin-conjugating enzyme n=1 Tax=Carpediemonas membranifera TaxID=201153 RepID=A0A8J6E9U3_9EUKA|nr:Ubiquitin-conjugating enzyme [Carpediemonas membranifera]|eukprot:KAG9393820.1 Ubiquitin-conjugating enzyme [Carpediemonas membranifera]